VSGERLRRRDRGTRHVRPAGPRGGWRPGSAPIEGREPGEVSLGAPTVPGTGPQAATLGVRPSGTAVAVTAVPEGDAPADGPSPLDLPAREPGA
jgi:hypothetical protein